MSTNLSQPMAIPYERITTSPPFEFLIGASKTTHYLPRSLVAHYSEPLSRLMSSNFKEGHENRVTLWGVDEATFIQFSEYLFTNDYITPSNSSEGEFVDLEDAQYEPINEDIFRTWENRHSANIQHGPTT